MKSLVAAFGLSFVMLCAQPAISATEEDPWEGFNRAMFSFNDGLDSVLLKPVAEGYKAITPTPVQKGVSNVFSNLGEIGNFSNNLLQGKWDATASSFFRFVINSTAGWFGIFDVASEMGLKRYEEDFGQTLGYWGVDSGPYLVLPFFGPSTVRDAGGLAVDYYNYDATDELDLNHDERWAVRGLDIVETRAGLLSFEGFIFGDRYSFIRDVYLQNRVNAVYDGEPPQSETASGDSWGDDSWGDDDWEDDDWESEEF